MIPSGFNHSRVSGWIAWFHVHCSSFREVENMYHYFHYWLCGQDPLILDSSFVGFTLPSTTLQVQMRIKCCARCVVSSTTLGLRPACRYLFVSPGWVKKKVSKNTILWLLHEVINWVYRSAGDKNFSATRLKAYKIALSCSSTTDQVVWVRMWKLSFDLQHSILGNSSWSPRIHSPLDLWWWLITSCNTPLQNHLQMKSW